MLQTTTHASARPIPPGAIGTIDRAIDPALSLDQPETLVKMALERGLLDEAEEAIAGLIAEDPSEPEPWVLRGVAALIRARNQQALDDFTRAAGLGGDERTTTLGGVMALMGLERHEDAWTSARALSSRHRDDPEVLHWLLRAGCATERWEALAEHVALYLDERPEDHSARFALAAVHVRRGDVVRARSEHEILRRVVPSFEGLACLETEIASLRQVRR
jgi:Flp pilus assembly protein TadD